MNEKPLLKVAQLLDILTPGEFYSIMIPGKKKVKMKRYKLIGCYDTYYLFENEQGCKETYLKMDLLRGAFKIDGLSVKDRVMEEVDKKKKEAEKVKVTKAMLEDAIVEGYNWIISNPGQNWFVSDKCKEFDGYQKKKIVQGVWDKLVFEGHENKVQQVVGPGGAKGFNLKLKIEPVVEEPKPEPTAAVLESTNELLRVDGLKEVTDQMFSKVSSTLDLLKLTGKNVVLDIVFREV